jgi:hypothetical protein
MWLYRVYAYYTYIWNIDLDIYNYVYVICMYRDACVYTCKLSHTEHILFRSVFVGWCVYICIYIRFLFLDNLYMYMPICIHMYISICVCVYLSTRTYICRYIYVYIQWCIPIYTFDRWYILFYSQPSIDTCIYVYICICLYLCVYT